MERICKNIINEDFDFNKVKSDMRAYGGCDKLLKYKSFINLIEKEGFVCRPIEYENTQYAVEVISRLNNKIPDLINRKDIEGFMQIVYDSNDDNELMIIQYTNKIKENTASTNVILELVYNNKIEIDNYLVLLDGRGHLVFPNLKVLRYFVDYITLQNIPSFTSTINIYISEYGMYNTCQTTEMHNDYVNNCNALIKKFGNLVENIHLFPYQYYSKWEVHDRQAKYWSAMDYRCFPIGTFHNVDDCKQYLNINGYKFMPEKALGQLAGKYLNFELSDELPNHNEPDKITPKISTKTLMLYMLGNFQRLSYVIYNIKNVNAILTNNETQLKVISKDIFNLDWMPVKVQLAYVGYITYTLMKYAEYIEDESHKLKYK